MTMTEETKKPFPDLTTTATNLFPGSNVYFLGNSIFITGVINDLTVIDFAEVLMKLRYKYSKNAQINLVINADGFNYINGLAMFNTIKSFSGKVSSVCNGRVTGAAVLPFIACPNRFMNEDGVLVIGDNTKANQITERVADIYEDAANTLETDFPSSFEYKEKMGKLCITKRGLDYYENATYIGRELVEMGVINGIL